MATSIMNNVALFDFLVDTFQFQRLFVSKTQRVNLTPTNDHPNASKKERCGGIKGRGVLVIST